MALKKDYGMALQGAFAPQYDRMEIRDDGKIILYFKNNDCGLGPVNEDLECFEVAGEDQVFYPASGRVMRGYDRIEVTCPPEVKVRAAVRYAFGNYVPGVLKNGRGVAVAPFRTDNWPEKK
jgi:sialate O-acetylesterase